MNTFKIASIRGQQGFTLLELILASSILVIAVTMGLAGFLYFVSEVNKASIQNKLDVDVQISMEYVRRDLRLTALDRMAFYPAGVGPYNAFSFPHARDDDGDGTIDIDEEGKIIWDKTLVYHIWTSEPFQLRRTTFDPRDESLSAAARQEQLDFVAIYGTGVGTHNGSNTNTEVIFENVFAWVVTPKSGTFDSYSPRLERDVSVVFGSLPLTNGPHNLQFTVTDKAAASSGYAIGVDSLFMSPSYSIREGEMQLPPTSESGAQATNVYMTEGSWSGNHQLWFPATATGATFTLTLENDRWEETNFRQPGESYYNTTVLRDDVDLDFVVTLEGNETNWLASYQSGDTNSGPTSADEIMGCAIRVLLRGQEVPYGSWIESSGARCRVTFNAGANALGILHAFIAEADTSSSNTMDAVPGTMTRLRFSGNNFVTILAGSSEWSDYTTFEIDKEKSYLVSYLVAPAIGGGNAWRWEETRDPSIVGTYIIPAASAPGESDASTIAWSPRTDLVFSNAILGVSELYTTHPTNGYYTSTIFDTAQLIPNYLTLAWSETATSDSDITIKVRTGANADLSDATGWTNITAMSSPGTINPGDLRYIQFQAELSANSTALIAPKLEHVITRWDGVTQAIDIGGTITTGPDYGIFELRVNGQELTRGMTIDLEIFDYLRAHGGSNLITSVVSTEVTPRNTGR